MHAPADKPSITQPPIDGPRVKTRWTYEEYYRMADAGVFRDRHVELIAGEIIEMPPQGEPHGVGIILADRVLRSAFGDAFVLRIQLPLHTGEDEEPEPDLAFVAGDPRASLTLGCPGSASLVVEVAVSSLAYDLGEKAEVYAAAGVEEYWVLDVVNRLLHVHRETIADGSLPRGRRYAHIDVLNSNATIAPLAAPKRPVRIADLLP